MTEAPLVSIVIVNYNAGGQLARCFGYIAQQAYPNWELIVVDNASSDGSLAAVSAREQVTVIQNTANVGFAVAQNQGIHASRGTYVMPLNYDIRMEPGFIEALIDRLEEDPRLGSACGKLLCMDSSWQPADVIDTTGLEMGAGCAPRSRGHGEVDTGQFDDSPWVFGAQGAAPLYRRATLDAVAWDGQFYDERYFMWYEDADLDWRVYLSGWGCQFVPEAVAYHGGHTSSRRDARYVRTTLRNRWWMILTNLGLGDLGRCWRQLLAQEWAQLRYAASAHLLGAYVSAALGALAAPAYVVSKRCHVRSRATRQLWTEAR